MIRFKKLRYRNFMSTGNSWSEFDLDNDLSTLIIGKNGAGKSTFVEGLYYCLFKKPLRKIKIPQLVNSITRKDCRVEVEFSKGSKEYKVIRGQKTNVFEIWENGVMINQDASSTDYQTYLENDILECSAKSFTKMVVLSKTEYVPFMDLPAGQRREFVENLLDLSIFTTMNLILKKKQAELADEIKSQIDQKKPLEDKLRLIRSYIQEAEDNTAQQISEIQKMIGDTQAELTKHDGDIENLDRLIEEITPRTKDNKGYQKTISSCDRIKIEIETKVRGVKKDIKFLQDNDTCPTCAQVIESQFKSIHLDEKGKKIHELTEGLTGLTIKRNEAQAEYDKVVHAQAELRAVELRRSIARSSFQSKTGYISQLEHQIETIRNKPKKVRKVEDDPEAIETQIKDIDKEMSGLRTTQEELIAVASMLKDDGIKAVIVKQYVPVINRVINKYLSSLEFFVDFRLDENFEETIKSRHRDTFTYHSFSEGEKMKIDLALVFTWRAITKLRSSMDTNLLIFDEIMDSSLDVDGTEEFLKIINQSEKLNTFIISHKTDSIMDKFNKVIRFENSNNFSKVVE